MLDSPVLFEDFQTSCFLCSMSDGRLLKHKDYFKILNGDRNPILRSSENFLVVPALGALIEGYLTIMSKKHVLSCAYLDTSELDELEDLVANTRQVLTDRYSAPTLFEHGPVSPVGIARTGGSCVNHLHLHAVPVSFGADRWLSKRYPWKKIEYLRELRAQRDLKQPYIFLELPNSKRKVFSTDVVPSQILRRLLAEHVGRPEHWNWRGVESQDKFLPTLEALSPWPANEGAL